MSAAFVTDYGVVMHMRHESVCAVMDDATRAAVGTAEQFIDEIRAAAEKRGIRLEMKMDYMYTVPGGD